MHPDSQATGSCKGGPALLAVPRRHVGLFSVTVAITSTRKRLAVPNKEVQCTVQLNGNSSKSNCKQRPAQSLTHVDLRKAGLRTLVCYGFVSHGSCTGSIAEKPGELPSLSVCLFFEKGSCYMAQAGLELMILLL